MQRLVRSPSEEIPFQGSWPDLWREIRREFAKLEFDRKPTLVGSKLHYLLASETIARIYSTVDVWHGTGRYHYGLDSRRLSDVLKGILSHGGLVPHYDDWDVKFGPVTTTCTALSRMYARLYASMHCPYGQMVENELGTRELWAYYFFITSIFVAVFEYRLGLRTLLKRDLTALIPDVGSKVKRWARKISSHEISQKDAFLLGTNISSNYPILIGIRPGAFKPSGTSKYINLHERRASSLIGLNYFSHIEVPEQRVEETVQLLSDYRVSWLRVLPIEFGEEYCRRFSFGSLSAVKNL
jgi:hypothetical protein